MKRSSPLPTSFPNAIGNSTDIPAQPAPAPWGATVSALEEVAKAAQGPTWARPPRYEGPTFMGVTPLVKQAAAAAGFRDHRLLTKALEIWHVPQVSSTLHSIAERPNPAEKQDAIDRAIRLRDSLLVAIDGIDAAIASVAHNHKLDASKLDAAPPKS